MKLRKLGMGVVAVPAGTKAGSSRGLGGAGNPTEERRLFFFFLRDVYSLGKVCGSKK